MQQCQYRVVPEETTLTYVSAGNLEGGNHTVTDLVVLDFRTDLIDDTTELVTEDITLL